MKRSYTDEERAHLRQEIEGRVNRGEMKIGESCRLSGVPGRTYRDWKNSGMGINNDFEETLERGNFDPHNWDHGWLKTEDVSLHIKNQKDMIRYEDVRDQMIEDMQSHSPTYPKIKREKTDDGHLLVFDIGDPHFGKYATSTETGEDYNIEIADKVCREALEGLIARANGFVIDKVLLVIGNDILHTDSPFRKTTAGTPQDTDGQWHEAFIAARKLYVHTVERLLTIADVHIVYNPSNHDFMSGFMLADGLQSWFHDSDQVTFDVDMKHRKYFAYGNSLIGTSHGDGAKENNLSELMATEARELWAQALYPYWYLHHVHHKKSKEYIGGMVEYLRSPSASDGWHDRNGYKSKRAIEAFVHSKTGGQVARFTHYIN